MAQTAGVKPMAIAGRVASERERCLGMTDAERAWRKQWLKDQVLASNEPVYVEEYWRERTNPIRRLYRKPLDVLFTKLMPVLGQERASNYRFIVGKLGMIAVGILSIQYYFKYNGNVSGNLLFTFKSHFIISNGLIYFLMLLGLDKERRLEGYDN
ncbi:unnamed protein product [Diatraea saccharalis]|uniref:NADH dehydrogenase [ubiquinone] 1 beta subcomplex subunit 6 n=1 Tax=Diatraea saccharalis TaxID=40085 RepID=A0A9P0C7J8_9NEOP|nr:unnamed protein product [Diatraea saccharalis]